MQKQLTNKKIILGICAVAVVAVVAIVMFMTGGEEAYRSILVYELEGNAVIDRAQIGAIDAAENLYLESGDRVSVAEDSMMRMKLDDDKYITAEENTVFALEAAGSDRDSKTKIHLEQGAVTNEIQNPLSSGSEYETATPNSVMAVRGTIYRVELVPDGEDGENTKVCCFEGTVEARSILPDGTLGEKVPVHAGNELTVYSDGTVGETKEIDYSSLPVQALETLDSIMENGTVIEGITQEDLSSLIAEAVSGSAQSEADETEQTALTADVEDTDAEAADNKVVGDGEEREQSDETDLTASGKEDQTGQKVADGSERAQKAEEKREPQKPQDQAPVIGKPAGTPTGGDSNSGSDEQTSDDNGSTDDSDDGKKDDSDSKPKKPSKEKTYTVTFKYQGNVFATQSVKSGETATAPTLRPAQSGSWDFDFSTKIEKNTEINWK